LFKDIQEVKQKLAEVRELLQPRRVNFSEYFHLKLIITGGGPISPKVLSQKIIGYFWRDGDKNKVFRSKMKIGWAFEMTS
jgi:hypothetical protein